MKKIALATLILLAAPVAAMAGGPAAPVVEPPISAPAPMMMAAPTVDWTGTYAGVKLGYGKSYTSGALKQGGTMHIAGADLGYRQDMGAYLLGGELSYDRDNINVGAADRTINSTAALKLIVGKSMGQTLFYGSLGVARADATLAGVKGSDTGYTAGIGADYALTQKITLGGELSTNRYNNFNGSGVTLKDTAFAVKVGFRF